jgi:hypothetical protein
MQNVTETQAIAMAKSILKDGFTISLMNANEIENFLWGYIYENGLQWSEPIFYVNEHGNQSAVIVHQ